VTFVPVVKFAENGLKALPVTSLTPEVTTTVYCVLAWRSAMGRTMMASPPPVVLGETGMRSPSLVL
jgi:hypothetical protein